MHWTASFPSPLLPLTKAHVQYGSGLKALYDMICQPSTVYDIILRLYPVRYQSWSHQYYDTQYLGSYNPY